MTGPSPRNLTPAGRFSPPIVLAAIAVAALPVLYRVNPNTTHVPLCPLHALTGLNCPLCGATRATYALLHGNLATALHDNAFYVAAIPLVAYGWFRWLGERSVLPRRGVLPAIVLRFVVVLFVVFGVVRNLPFGAWLSPAA